MVGIYSIDVMLPLSLTFYWSVIILFIIIVITICFSPRILNKKSRNRFVDGKLEKCIPLAISIGGSAIGFAILIYVILSRSVKFDILRLIITILSFSGVVLVLPYIVLGFYEAIVLAISKWPRVERLGSEFKILG